MKEELLCVGLRLNRLIFIWKEEKKLLFALSGYSKSIRGVTARSGTCETRDSKYRNNTTGAASAAAVLFVVGLGFSANGL